jgi:hypothetical protein
MAAPSNPEFFSAALTAGTILIGFSASFLQFRIQREANYYRQPALSFEYAEAKDIFIGLSHFTSSFLLIIVSTMLDVVFGFFLPLLVLAEPNLLFISPRLVIAGLIAALVFLVGYFCAELVHYRILNRRLIHDMYEWERQWPLVITTFNLSILLSAVTFFLL